MTGFAKRTIISTCIMFTIFMAGGSIAVIALTGPQYGLTMTLTLLLAAFLLAVLRGIWFTDKLIRTLAYPLRIIGFGITSFMALTACALIGQWFPLDNAWAWASFALIFLAVLVVCCIAYQIRFKLTVGSFDAALRAYHERMGR